MTGETAAGLSVSRRAALKVAVGFAIALLLVYLLGWVIGWGRTVDHLRAARLRWVLAACLSTVLCLAAWARTWQLALASLGVAVGYRRLVVTFHAAAFANYVTPMGQAGGEPLIAYILARDTTASYEQSLASVLATDLLRVVPFFSVGLVGLGYLIAAARLPGTAARLAVVLVALALAVPAGVAAAWHWRAALKRGLAGALGPLAARTDRVDRRAVHERLDRLEAAIAAIAATPRTLVVALAWAYGGWLLFALPLYFAGRALGLAVPLLLVCFLVPVTVIAGSTPLPGGLAVIEGTLVALLSALLALSTSEALAVTTLYRLTSYWFVVAVGGLAALWVLARA